jgi:hypothetical protein
LAPWARQQSDPVVGGHLQLPNTLAIQSNKRTPRRPTSMDSRHTVIPGRPRTSSSGFFVCPTMALPKESEG